MFGLGQLWHVLHDDGDAEDVEAHELEKAARYYEGGIEEQPHSADEVRFGTSMARFRR